MSLMGTFDTFTAARLGIIASQKGLSITGNNISNINTVGYTRQKLNQNSLKVGGADRYQSQFDVKVGTGVICNSVSQIRDPYLDIRYRTEMAKVGYQDTLLAGMNDLQAILDEVGDGDYENGIIHAQLNDFADKLIRLGAEAGKETSDTLVRTSAEALVTLFNTYADKLETLKENTVKGFKEDVQEINDILTSIRELNSAIRKSDIHGDAALELRDERNNLIDDLSQFMNIDVVYSEEDLGGGIKVEKLTIRLGNSNPDDKSPTDQATLVDGIYCTQLAMPHMNPAYDPTDPASIPYMDESTPPQPTDDITKAALLGDSATLKDFEASNPNFDIALLELKDAKGRVMKDPKTGDPIEAVGVLDDNDILGSLSATREMLTEAGEFTTAGTIEKVDENAASKRGIPYYQKSLDLLAQQFAEAYNHINTQYATDSDGYYYDIHNNGTIDGLIKPGMELTQEIIDKLNARGGTQYTFGTTTIQDILADHGKKVGLFSNSGDSDDMTGITAKNISISLAWSTKQAHVIAKSDDPSFVKPDDYPKSDNDLGLPQSTQCDNINHMISLIDKDMLYNPQKLNEFDGKTGNEIPTSSHLFNGSFQEMLDNMVGVLGSEQRSTNIKLNTYYGNSVELNASRDGVSGVDLNDEAMSLMQYSKSLNAAYRLMTTIDEALERLINNTGVVGR